MDLSQLTGHIWLDGEMVPWQEAKVHVLTHTFHYGLGVFEGCACVQHFTGRRYLSLAGAYRSLVSFCPHIAHGDALRQRDSE